MTTPMPDEHLAAIDQRIAALNAHCRPGEWRYDGGDDQVTVGPAGLAELVATIWGESGSDEERALGEFIAAARQDVPALRAEVDRLQRAVQLLGTHLQGGSQHFMDALAEAERLRAARCSCDGDPIECGHEAARGQAEAELARVRAMLADARDRCNEAETKLHQVAMTKVWTNEDGKRFVFVEDLAAVLLPPPPADHPTPEQVRLRQAFRQAGERVQICTCSEYGPWCPSCQKDAAALTAALAEEAGDLDG